MSAAPEPGTDLAPVEPLALPSVIGPPSPSEWEAMQQQVAMLAHSGLVPDALRGKPDDIMVILLAGREVGVAPIMAMNRIHVVQGRATMSAELMLALVLRAGHSLDIIETNGEHCKVRAARRRSDTATMFDFTMEDARAAKLADKGTWKQYPAAMLRARAISTACRAVFPDVLMGISYVPEEVGADVDPVTGEVTPPTEDTIPEATQVALRERIMALPDYLRDSLRETMKERGWILTRLPVRLLGALEDEIAGQESWVRKPDDPAPDDSTPAEATIVDTPGPDGIADPPGDDVEDAEVVTHGGDTTDAVKAEKLAELDAMLASIDTELPDDVVASISKLDRDHASAADVISLLSRVTQAVAT